MNAQMKALARRKLLEDIYDRMNDEEKRIFIFLTMQDKSDKEIKAALQQQQAQLADIRTHQQTFAADFASNIAGNAVWDGAAWLLSKLARLLK